MKNKYFFLRLLMCLAAATICGYALAVSGKNSSMASGQLELIGSLTSKALENNHLRKLEQNESLSSRVFDEYFKQLDPGKVYFTQLDIAAFGKDRFRMLDKLNNGEQQFIYDIYQFYLERLREYQTFITGMLKKDVEFDSDETYCVDRENSAYCRDEKELKELWRKRLKNDLLYYRLMQKVMAEKATDPEVSAELKKRWAQKSPEEKVLTRMHDLYNYAAQADKMDILGIFLTAMAQVYGPHSHYSTPKQEEDFEIQFKLSLTGIGATLTSEDGYIKVVDLVPGGPADKDGRLQPEDRIIAVAQENGEAVDVVDMSVNNAVKLVRGPAGSKVTLTILPAAKGSAALPQDITIVRGKVELKENEAAGSVHEAQAPDGSVKRIGVIKLNNFYMDFEGAARGEPDYRSCTRDIRKILEDFTADKVDAVVLDLRSNSGGSLLEAITLSGLFITRGPIVQVVDASRKVEVQTDPDRRIAYTGALVVLVSKFSASSAEILTGAMQDYRRALIVGDSRTFGKGTVLSVTDLSRLLRFVNSKLDAGSLTHEVAMFYRVNGESNQARGVIPDIILPSFTECMEIGEVYSDNHLPWSKIDPVELSPASRSKYRMLSTDTLVKVQQNVNKRWHDSPALLKLQKDVERFKAVRARKEVSLNEKQRLKEYYDEKAAAEKMDQIMEKSGQNKAENSKKDPLLNEAVTIAADYVYYQNQEK